MNKEPISYFIFQDKTLFIPFRYIYPECFFHIKDYSNLFPMKCFLEDACPQGANCGEVLVRRIHYLFDVISPDVELIIAYFKYRDKPKSIRGAIFNRDLSTPNVSILNPNAFRKFMREGITYQWVPTDEYLFMGGSKGLIKLNNTLEY